MFLKSDSDPLFPPPPLKKLFYFNESPLKMMKNAFYFTAKALFVLKIFKFLSFVLNFWSCFKIYYAATWLTNNYNTHIAQYLTK